MRMSAEEECEVETMAEADEINNVTKIGVHTSREAENQTINVTGITGGEANTVYAIGYLQGNIMVSRDHKLKALKDKTVKETRSRSQGMMKTRAVNEILSRLTSKQSWVTICGHPGEGKTTTGYLVLQELLEKKLQVFHVDTPEDYFTIVREVSNCVIMLNDILGQLAFDPLAFSKWESVIHHYFEAKKHESNNISIIFVSRTNVLEGARSHFGQYESNVLGGDVVIDISHVTENTYAERIRLLDWYFKGTIEIPVDVKDNLASGLCPFGFAYCCKLYAQLKEMNDSSPYIEKFFVKPLKFLGQTTKVLVANSYTKTMFKAMLKGSGKLNLESLTDSERYSFMKVANELKGCYLKQTDSIVEFSHPSIQESVAYFIGKDDPLFAMKHFDISYLLQKVILIDVEHDESEFLYITPTKRIIQLLCLRAAPILLDLDFSILQHELFRRKEVCEQLFENCVEVKNCVRKLTNRLFLKKQRKLDINSRDRNGNTLLHAAHRGHNRAAIDTLLKLGADVNIYNEKWGMKQSTYFQLACMDKPLDTDHIRQMVEEAGKLDLRLYSGSSILHQMYHSGEHQLLRLLLYRGADPDTCDTKNKTLLHHMCKDGCSLSELDVLLENGANVNKIKSKAPENWSRLWSKKKRGKTALHYLCSRYCNIKMVELLLRSGAKVDIEDQVGQIPLHYACAQKNQQVVKELLHYGSDPNSVDDSGNTPLHYLYDSGNYKGIELLLDHGANVNIPTQKGKTLLHYECQRGKLDPEFLRMILRHGADVNIMKRKNGHKKRYGKTPLHYLAKRGIVKQGKSVVELLCQNGANVNCRDAKGKTPLQIAYESENAEMFTILLERGSDINIEDNEGWSITHWAYHEGRFDKLKELISYGADVNKRDKEGKTLLHYVCLTEEADPSLVDLLLAKGADVNVRKEYKLRKVVNSETLHEKIQKVNSFMKLKGKTALHYACKFQKDSTTIRKLIAAGASVNMTDSYEMTPLLYLLVNEDMDFEDLCFLLSEGADPCHVNCFGQNTLDLLDTRRNVDSIMVDCLRKQLHRYCRTLD